MYITCPCAIKYIRQKLVYYMSSWTIFSKIFILYVHRVYLAILIEFKATMTSQGSLVAGETGLKPDLKMDLKSSRQFLRE